MAAKGDDHVWREHVAKARQMLPDLRGLKARERSRRVGKRLGLALRQADKIRIAAEREVAAAVDDSCPPDLARKRLLEDLDDIHERTLRILEGCPPDQPSAAIAALKLLLALAQERGKWQGARPVDEESAGGTRPVEFSFGGRGDG